MYMSRPSHDYCHLSDPERNDILCELKTYNAASLSDINFYTRRTYEYKKRKED